MDVDRKPLISLQRRFGAAAVGFTALAGAVFGAAPAAHAATYPGNTTYSRYVAATDMYAMGCNQGKASDSQGQPHQAVILSFGDPGWVNYGTWGAWDTYIGGFNSDATIENNVERYMQGFWDCTVNGSNSHMIVAPGVTNAGSGINSDPSTAAALGSAWGGMVKDLNSWIAAKGYTRQLAVMGAIDAEPSWGTYAYSEAWANGFMSAAGSLNYYDFGSADGCPTAGSGACNNGWTQAEEYQMAWGNATAIAVPQIYTNDGAQAQQWAAISAWGAAHGSSGAIKWAAALSQYQACIDHNDPCSGTSNTPYQSWQQLTSASGTAPYFTSEMSFQAN
jgi:hypothetical protein